MGDYDLYADGYINRCFRLYNLSYYDYDADEPAPNVAYNTLNINALPYDFLGNQYFELEFRLNMDNQAAPLFINIGSFMATLVFYKNLIWMYYTGLSPYVLSPPLSGWNRIKIKYDHGTWDIYLNDVLLVPSGGDKYLLITDPVNSIKFYSFLIDTSFPPPVFYYNLVDEIKINPPPYDFIGFVYYPNSSDYSAPAQNSIRAIVRNYVNTLLPGESEDFVGTALPIIEAAYPGFTANMFQIQYVKNSVVIHTDLGPPPSYIITIDAGEQAATLGTDNDFIFIPAPE